MIEHLVEEKRPGGFQELVKWTETTHSHTENSVPRASRFTDYDTDNMQKS